MKHMLKIDAFLLIAIGAGCVGAAIFASADYDPSILILIAIIAVSLSSAIMDVDRRLGVLESKADDSNTGRD